MVIDGEDGILDLELTGILITANGACFYTLATGFFVENLILKKKYKVHNPERICRLNRNSF